MVIDFCSYVFAGFVEARRSCCGKGTLETTSALCNPNSPRTCSNATQYVFWDNVHPSQAANQVIADAMIVQGIALIWRWYVVSLFFLSKSKRLCCSSIHKKNCHNKIGHYYLSNVSRYLNYHHLVMWCYHLVMFI